jgi:hypothetical protein
MARYKILREFRIDDTTYYPGSVVEDSVFANAGQISYFESIPNPLIAETTDALVTVAAPNRISDTAGAAGGSGITLLQSSGRTYLYAPDGNGDTTWVADGHAAYGPWITNYTEIDGVGATPDFEYNVMGHWVTAGTKLKWIDYTLRITDPVTITGLAFCAAARYGHDATAWVDGIAEGGDMTNHVLVNSANVYTDSANQENGDFSSVNKGQFIRFRYALDNYEMPQDGWLTTYLKPVRASDSTGTDYVYGMKTWAVETGNVLE